MRGTRRFFFQSLWFRLLAPLLFTVAAVLAIHALVSFGSTKDHFVRFVRADVERYSGLIKRATHDGMLLNRKDEVQSVIERLAEGPEIASIRIYDKQGAIAMSARAEEIGRKIDIDSETCFSCHSDEPTKDTALLEQNGFARIGGGPEVLRHLSVIENERSCATAACHAHPADEQVLGVLDLEMSMAPLDAAVRTSQLHFLWTTIVLVLFVGGVVAVFLRRTVQRPVLQLYQGTRRIAEGDLDTRIEVRGHHELASLAEAFNQMAVDLRAARQEVMEWSQKLEEKVIQKTEELGRAQRQVLHMEKMASLGKLSATVAHELNNPITGMLIYAQLVKKDLAEQPLDLDVREEVIRYLSMIERECSRCGSIVQNLLLFARRSGAAMAPTDLNEVIERSLMLVRHHLEMGGIELRSEPLEGDSRIVADAAQLQQALVALLVNSVESMNGSDRPRKELSVSLRGSDDAVEISIADTGEGIPAEVLPQIFEPFFSTKESGVGLGLAVAYGIVRRHGGRIQVDSEVGRGTVFHLHLPRHAVADEEESPAIAQQASGQP